MIEQVMSELNDLNLQAGMWSLPAWSAKTLSNCKIICSSYLAMRNALALEKTELQLDSAHMYATTN